MNQTEKKNETRTPRRARWRRLLARGAAGMTLIEIMVVVIIMGLIASGVGFAVFNQLKKARIKTTEQAVETVRAAVRLYENDHPGQCPTMENLVSEGHLERSRATTDAWGHPFVIQCENGEVQVSSNGPNGRPGDDDDIPNPSQQR
jgi:general secretion pathway protein G